MRHKSGLQHAARLLQLALIIIGFMTLAGCGDSLGRFHPPVDCTPSCSGRECGANGCGGSCGDCDAGLFCEPMTGACVGEGRFAVYGSIDLEYMFGDARGGRVVLSGPDEAPGTGILATVVDAGGKVLGANFVSGVDGSFSIAVERPVVGTEKLILSTLWAPEGEVIMAVLDPLTNGNDSGQATFDPFAWYADVPAGGNVGSLTISVEDGSGALFVFLMNKVSFENIVAPIVERHYDGESVGLAVFFGAYTDVYIPCTCYHGEKVTYVGSMKGPKLNTRISVVDQPGDSSAWGWAVLFHEFGHYVLGAYSKDDSAGGYHYLGQTLKPKFAFSEGWASFMALVTATLWFNETWPVYWDIQGASWFYVDFLAGLYFSQSGGTTEMVFPVKSSSSTQLLDENWVARTLYMIWDGSGTSDDPDATMTLQEMTDTIASTLFLRGDFDGWTRDADMYNFLDSAICLFPEKNGALTDRVMDEFGFPYAGNPDCPKTVAMSPASLPRQPIVRDFDTRRDAAATNPPVRTPRTSIPPVTIHGVTIDSAVRINSSFDSKM